MELSPQMFKLRTISWMLLFCVSLSLCSFFFISGCGGKSNTVASTVGVSNPESNPGIVLEDGLLQGDLELSENLIP